MAVLELLLKEDCRATDLVLMRWQPVVMGCGRTVDVETGLV
jgi:hypothetical protein